MSNSPLVVHTNLSPNCHKPRKADVDRISIHCVVGQVTAESLGYWFAKKSTQASSNYGVDLNGRIGMYVEECNRSWCTSSPANDHRAITIEVASDTTAPYAVRDKAYNALIELIVDICKRHGKNKLLWFGDKQKTLAYVPAPNEMVLTIHQWFAATACPGQYLLDRHPDIAARVNAILQPEEVLYRVQIGAFKVKANAEAQLEKAKAAGFSDAFIVESKIVKEQPKQEMLPTLKSIDEIAQEVINGKWGNGAERKQRLIAAGYDFGAVQKRVNELLK